ncbi:MAG: putative toxin-antitoxin system toxin component, PIN family [Verrucomicrobiota bacterium]
MKLVLDTNVLVSALLTKDTPPDQLYLAWEAGQFELVTSSWQIDELRRVLGYEKLKPYIKPMEASLLLENIDAMAEIIGIAKPRTESSDPDDNWILATAVEGGADLLVTGDKNDLLKLKEVGGVRIVNAREALKLIER